MPGEDLTSEEMNLLRKAEEERALDDRIVVALESAPDLSFEIPADFAVRVAAQVPSKKPVVVRSTHYGKVAMWIGLAVLLVVLMILPVRNPGESMAALTVEGLLLVQFVAIVGWLSVRRWREG